MIKNIATVAVYVEDQQKAKAFWTEKMGFEVTAQHPMGPHAFWLEVAPKDAQSKLVLYPKAMMEGHETKQASIVFDTENIEDYYVKLKERGVELVGKPQKMQWGTFVQFLLIDMDAGCGFIPISSGACSRIILFLYHVNTHDDRNHFFQRSGFLHVKFICR
jgi:predicted enzyme related to lactoylglutathione lyase